MSLIKEIPWKNYQEQEKDWPQRGRHVMALYDADKIVVYQAFRQETAKYAVENQKFGGNFYSFNRMTWIKPNFLWMMYRAGWASKPGQESILAISIKRSFFDFLLESAVWSSFSNNNEGDRETWKNELALSEVRLQWDPDHDPAGGKLERRAIQIGIRGECLSRFNQEAVLSIDDISAEVKAQSAFSAPQSWGQLNVPQERVYCPVNEKAVRNIRLDAL